MPKKFMYVCLGILALVGAFHLGAMRAESLTTGSFVDLCIVPYENEYEVFALQDDGTIYWSYFFMDNVPESFPGSWPVWGQIAGGGFVEPTTWGEIKAQFGEGQ